jgi:hypothetical protein
MAHPVYTPIKVITNVCAALGYSLTKIMLNEENGQENTEMRAVDHVLCMCACACAKTGAAT